VVRDELNLFLKPHGLFFGPGNVYRQPGDDWRHGRKQFLRLQLGVYRSTREHLLEVKALLSDGSEAHFKALDIDAFHRKCEGTTLEASIYKTVRRLLSNQDNAEEIRAHFPKKSVERRNTGYAVDILLEAAPFTLGGEDFNFCKLIAGSEGTLAFITEIKLNVVPLPPKETGLLCVHFTSIDAALRANLIALKAQTQRQRTD
jgi:FAD/FMN-containing dehydrogenase